MFLVRCICFSTACHWISVQYGNLTSQPRSWNCSGLLILGVCPLKQPKARGPSSNGNPNITVPLHLGSEKLEMKDIIPSFFPVRSCRADPLTRPLREEPATASKRSNFNSSVGRIIGTSYFSAEAGALSSSKNTMSQAGFHWKTLPSVSVDW